jgi:hypothetical protein
MNLLNRRALALLLAPVTFWPARAFAAEANIPRPKVQEVWARTELYFGTDREGGDISDHEFFGFMDQYITPLFPDGLTLLSGRGQFLNSRGVLIKERSKVLILFYPVSMRDANQKIEEIRRNYKDHYQQESVLRVDSYVVLSF